MLARRNQKIARALGRGGCDDRRLELAEILRPHALAHRGHHVRAQFHVLLQLFTAQIEIAILQARFLRIFLITEHHQRQFGCSAQDFDVANEHLNFARWDFGVHQALVARHDVAINADTPLRTHLFDLGKYRAIGIGHDLRDAVMIAQIDEQKPAMIAHAVDPTGKTHGLAYIGFIQIGASMAAVGVHGVFLRKGV